MAITYDCKRGRTVLGRGEEGRRGGKGREGREGREGRGWRGKEGKEWETEGCGEEGVMAR